VLSDLTCSSKLAYNKKRKTIPVVVAPGDWALVSESDPAFNLIAAVIHQAVIDSRSGDCLLEDTALELLDCSFIHELDFSAGLIAGLKQLEEGKRCGTVVVRHKQ
jgi:hypothetical protein